MKKKRIIGVVLLVGFLLVGTIGIFNFATKNQQQIKVVMGHSSHRIYKDLNELEEDSDLIVVGNLNKSFKNHKPTLHYTDDNEQIAARYSVLDIKAKEIIKGNIEKNSIIKTIYDGALVDNKLYFSENVPLMLKGRKYILFLKKVSEEFQNDDQSIYSIISLNQGIYEFGNTGESIEEINLDMPYNPVETEQYKKLKGDILEKYKNLKSKE